MRYALVFVAMAAAVAAQDSSASYTNPFTSYLTQTNSVGVVTGHPPVNTDVNTDVFTSEPSVITSQPAVATSPAGTPTAIPTLSKAAGSAPLATGNSGSGSSGNSTVSTGSLKPSGSSGASGAGSSGASTRNSDVGGSGSTPTATASGSGTSSTGGSSGAGALEPVLGLGLAGAAFALFL